eukprot:COSAG02_NODE_51211_length_315_cov_1.407407_1_plen_70_part_01
MAPTSILLRDTDTRGTCTRSFDVSGHEFTDVRGLDLRRGGGDASALVWVGKPGLCTAVELYPGGTDAAAL